MGAICLSIADEIVMFAAQAQFFISS